MNWWRYVQDFNKSARGAELSQDMMMCSAKLVMIVITEVKKEGKSGVDHNNARTDRDLVG